MLALIVILIILACIALAFIVLIQNSKGGGLVSNFAASNQYLGVKNTTDKLEKTTWGLAALIMVLCFACAFMSKSEFKKDIPSMNQTEQAEGEAEE